MGKKETEYEVLEGGDDSEDELSYSESQGSQEKIDSLDTEKDESQKEESTEDEKLRFKDGDDDWDKDQEGAEEKEVEEKVDKEEVKEEKVEKEEVKEEKKELSEEEKQDKKTQEDVIKYLEEDGGDARYIVKGKEYNMRDLSPQEWKQRFSLAGRAYQGMEENAVVRKQLELDRQDIDEAARNSQEIMRKYGREPSGETEQVPDALKPNEDDTDEVSALKEMNANLYNRVDKLESDGKQQNFKAQEQDLYRQLDSLEKEFPMLSKSEVVAVKSMPEFANADIRTIAENSHNNRVSDEYLDSVFKARPDRLREIEENAIEKHLMKNPKVKKVSRKTSSTVASKKISSTQKRSPKNWDEIEARDDEFERGLTEARDEDAEAG